MQYLTGMGLTFECATEFAGCGEVHEECTPTGGSSYQGWYKMHA